MTPSPHDILKRAKTVAIVGLSDKPDRASYRVASYLKDAGYRIFPVNPRLKEVLGLKCFEDLSAIPEPVDLVDIFRKPDDCLPVTEEAIKIGAKVIWLQLGIHSEACRQLAEAAGVTFIEDKCTKIEHEQAF